MSRNNISTITVLVCAALVAVGASDARAAAALSPSYRVQIIDPGTSSYGSSINPQGWVVGVYDPSGVPHSFLYDGTIHELGAWVAGGLNATGQIVGNGFSRQYDGLSHQLQQLKPIPFTGIEVNASGQVSGSFSLPDGGVHAGLYNLTDGSLRDLGTLGGGFSAADAINDAGQVAGASFPANSGFTHAFLYDGTMRDLGTLGGTVSGAFGLNAAGVVTGYSRTASGAYHAFLFDTKMRDIGTLGGLSIGQAINNAGQIAGRSEISPAGPQHAFIYDSVHGMRDLNALIQPLSGVILEAGYGINDAGQITGQARISTGDYRPFIATPIPEPTSIWLILPGVAALFRWRILGSVLRVWNQESTAENSSSNDQT